MLVHIPLGNPEAVQWHCAADLNELQNADVFVGVARGQPAKVKLTETSENKLTYNSIIFFIIIKDLIK